MPKSNEKKKQSPKPPDISQFESAVQSELETVEEIAMHLYRYGGRVRARILAHVNELLSYTEE